MCINCDENSTTIPNGDDGIQGPQGLFGGYCAKWNFSTSTSSGPSSGELRLNSSTYSSVASIFVNKTNSETIDYAAFLASFDNDGYFGLVRIFKEDDSSIFWMGEVLAITDNGSDYSIDVSYTLSNGAFTTNDSVVICFTPTGVAPVIIPQRINTVFRSETFDYVSTNLNTLVAAGTLVYDKATFGDVLRAKVVVAGDVVSQSFTVRVTDIDGNILWNSTRTCNTGLGLKEVIDLGTVLTLATTNLNFLQVDFKSDGTNALQIYSIDFYNT